MEALQFVIDETPYCCWDWRLLEKNLEFLEGIDSSYFKYIVESNIDNLNNDYRQQSATALRLAYSHGLEALFALLCSAVQAPRCSIGWVLNYKNVELISIVKKISKNEPFHTRLIGKPINWETLSCRIHAYISYEDDKKDWIQKGFGKAWSRFANEFTDENFTLEYNGIKHGLRARPGGFYMAYGHEETPGVPAPPEKMITLGGSEYGTSYFVKEQIAASNKVHFRPRHHSRNWNPNNLAHGLRLISMSINNVISWLRAINGVPLENCEFVNPSTKEAFDAPWEENVGVTHTTFDEIVSEHDIELFPKDKIINSYE